MEVIFFIANMEVINKRYIVESKIEIILINENACLHQRVT